MHYFALLLGHICGIKRTVDAMKFSLIFCKIVPAVIFNIETIRKYNKHIHPWEFENLPRALVWNSFKTWKVRRISCKYVYGIIFDTSLLMTNHACRPYVMSAIKTGKAYEERRRGIFVRLSRSVMWDIIILIKHCVAENTQYIIVNLHLKNLQLICTALYMRLICDKINRSGHVLVNEVMFLCFPSR